MELETNIVDVSEDVLDQLFDETPDKTVNADQLLGGKKPVDTSEEDDEEEEGSEPAKKPAKQKKAATKVKQQAPAQAIENIDVDSLGDEDEEEEVEEEETEEEEEETEEDKQKKAAKGKAKGKEKEGAEPNKEIYPVLKSTVDFLIDQGLWQDFDGREDLDIDQETYAKLVAAQDTQRVSSMFNELVDSTGPFGKAIIEFVKNGGSPDEIIDLFKEQKQVESISTESEDGQKEMIKHYYSEVLGWKQEKIDKYISQLVLSNELENEANETKELFGNYYKKETERISKEREEFVKAEKAKEEAFESNIRTAIKNRKDLTPSEKKVIEDYVLTYDQRLPNGNRVNKFYVNFAKMQANPDDYIDLINFVMDKQKFMQKISTKEKTSEAAKAFNFIKGNAAVSTKKGSSYDSIKKQEKTSTFDWGM